jgi:hypothetical protein
MSSVADFNADGYVDIAVEKYNGIAVPSDGKWPVRRVRPSRCPMPSLRDVTAARRI